MSKTLINFWLDSLLLVVLLVGLWTTFVIRFAFPPGTAAAGWTLWGATYDQWTEFQFWTFCSFGFGILIHIMLHWTWVCGVLTTKLQRRVDGHRRTWTDGERTLVGVGVMVVVFHVLGAAFGAASLMVQSP